MRIFGMNWMRAVSSSCLEFVQMMLRCQVLLVTHHRRVIGLADGLEEKAGIFTHELD